MGTYEKYTAELTEASQKKAKDELNELPEENRDQLKQFTDWIETHKKWLTAPTDPVFLMSFLRVRKSSQLLARETLVNFLLTREKDSQFFSNMDVDDEKILAVLKSTFYVPIPNRDKDGRQVLILRPGRLDVSGRVYKKEDVTKVMFMVIDYMLRSEDVQVNGILLFLDYKDVTRKTQSFIGDARIKFMKIFTKTYPVRLKKFLLYNVGPFLELLMGIIKSAMREKLQKRIEVMSDMTGVYEHVGKSNLPLEYLPDDYDGEHADSCEQITESLIENLRKPENRTWIKELSSGRFRVDESKMPPREELFQEAFRKLNVD